MLNRDKENLNFPGAVEQPDLTGSEVASSRGWFSSCSSIFSTTAVSSSASSSGSLEGSGSEDGSWISSSAGSQYGTEIVMSCNDKPIWCEKGLILPVSKLAKKLNS